MQFGTAGSAISVNCLLDTGSQLNLIDKNLIKPLIGKSKSKILSLNCLDQKKKVRCWNSMLPVRLPDDTVREIEFHACQNLEVSCETGDLSNISSFCQEENIPLSPNFLPFVNNTSGNIPISCIIGIGSLKYFTPFELVSYNEVSFFRLSNGYLPVGDVASTTVFRNILCHQIRTLKKNCNFTKTKLQNDKLNTFTSKKLKSPKIPTRGHIPERIVKFVTSPYEERVHSPVTEIFSEQDCWVEQGLESFLNSSEITEVNNPSVNSSDEAELKNFKNSVEIIDNKYYLTLPWRRNLLAQIPNNFALCKLAALRVYKNTVQQKIASDYYSIFSEMLNSGIIEKLPFPFDIKNHKFITHRPVVRLNDDLVTSTKIRPVFNCSLKIGKSPSLNQAAVPTPDLMNSLLFLLLHFRQSKFCLLADLEKAFLQLKLKSLEDRNMFSFVIYYNNKYQYFRFNTVLFGYINSPFFLNYILKLHAEKYQSPLSHTLSSHFYVDNLIYTHDNAEIVKNTLHDSRSALNEAGFNLRDIVCNDSSIMSEIDSSIKGKDVVKVLGVTYDSSTDNFSLKVPKLNTEACTKRSIISTISSVFDPLGFLGPLTLTLKFQIRAVSSAGTRWDEKLPDEIINSWLEVATFFNSLNISQNKFPRFCFTPNEPYSFAVFSDASKLAFGFVIYMIQGNKVSFFYSTNKLAPKNSPSTLPKLEFLALFNAIKFINNILHNDILKTANLQNIYFLADSQVCLSWAIANKPIKSNIFVSNRIPILQANFRQISEVVGVKVHLRHVASTSNPADFLTKVSKVQSIDSLTKEFLSGPNWLLLPFEEWPQNQLSSVPANSIGENNNLILNVTTNMLENSCVIDIFRFSNLDRLINSCSYVFKFIRTLQYNSVEFSECKTLAFNYLIRCSQQIDFCTELRYLENSSVSKNTHVPPLVRNLMLFVDDKGILRSRGRITANTYFTKEAVNPIVLSGRSKLAELFIRKSHFDTNHLGLNSTLQNLRMGGIWITFARGSVKRVIKTCCKCQRYNASLLKSPSFSLLPESRTRFTVAFDVIGIDYTSHFTIRNADGTEDRTYILIFTCFSTRAIHLEITPTMETLEFIRAFYRFCNLYGVPRIVISDNATNFVAGGNLLGKLISHDQVKETFDQLNISFQRIPAYTPTAGAVYERMIKTVKLCINKCIGRKVMSLSEFSTLLSDIKVSINNRPLYYRSINNELCPLSPNHFISLKSMYPNLTISADKCADYWKSTNKSIMLPALVNSLDERKEILDNFSEIFHKEYVAFLREVGFKSSFNKSCPLNLGDICLLRSPVKTRAFWSLIQITKLITGRDGLVRTVEVRKPDGSLLITGIANVLPLELEGTFEEQEINKRSSENLNATKNSRKAKLEASKKLTQLALRGAT